MILPIRGILALTLAITAPLMATGATQAQQPHTACGVWGMAHRGYQADHDENSTGAIRAAGRLRLVAETDMRLTLDGHKVMAHDPGIERTTDGHGLLIEMSLTEVQSYPMVSHGDIIPTFWQAARAASRSKTTLLVEIKRHNNESAWTHEQMVGIGNVVRHFAWGRRTWMYVNTEKAQLEFMEAAPNVRWVIKADRGDPYDLASIQAYGPEVEAVMLYQWQTTKASVQEFHEAGYKVFTRFTNNPKVWLAEAKEGVDRLLTGSPLRFKRWCARHPMP